MIHVHLYQRSAEVVPLPTAEYRASLLTCDAHPQEFVELVQRINLECGISVKINMFWFMFVL